jgi:hypothetical protein
MGVCFCPQIAQIAQMGNFRSQRLLPCAGNRKIPVDRGHLQFTELATLEAICAICEGMKFGSGRPENSESNCRTDGNRVTIRACWCC